MTIPEVMQRLGVTSRVELELDLCKVVYDLKEALVQPAPQEASRDWFCAEFDGHVRALQSQSRGVGSGRCIRGWMIGHCDQAGGCGRVFGDLALLSVKDLGRNHKLLGMRVNYDDESGYELDQEVNITDMLKEHGVKLAH
ncbi:hypothetical protein PC129_g9495 [Phytophthora cactorum]|nr:hypothetical protein Pcac1_g15277 [Phytophthora cactorum]KAG2814989.1 hypothetical protein PC111_g13739 [Phytophthora cactorum]KAG2821459.1 hypothetical protein PC112_g11362 [Phytophthora cactorum]KAG2858956.1 hypothetical protein PC113_g9345 [Phytophthora cactorum]KAG2906799.1 hypothetical protein PC115_g14155 [Phytophthora cactorum]